VGHVLRKPRVEVITAALSTTHQLENKIDIYRAYIGTKTFEINQSTYEALKEGHEYSVYYLPQTDELLSIELPVSEDEQERLAVNQTAGEKKKNTLTEPFPSSDEDDSQDDSQASFSMKK
jgi:hypothetical protein